MNVIYGSREVKTLPFRIQLLSTAAAHRVNTGMGEDVEQQTRTHDHFRSKL
jgi:hypothetical protein